MESKETQDSNLVVLDELEELVYKVVHNLPEEFRDGLQNIDFLVEDMPSPYQRKKAGLKSNQLLLGLYEGVPRTRRRSSYGMVLPDKITIFQKAVEYKCRSERAIVNEIERVVKHEIAHHFGISDDRLKEIGRY